MKRTSEKLLLTRKLVVRTETIALLTPFQLARVAGGTCSEFGTCNWPYSHFCVNEYE